MSTQVTHIATRSRRAGKALFQYPMQLSEDIGYAEQLEQLRSLMFREITKETLERPSVLLIGIEGSKK